MSLFVLCDLNFPNSDCSSVYSTNKRELQTLENLNSFEFVPLITTGQAHHCGSILDNIVIFDNFITGFSMGNKSLSQHSSTIFNYSSDIIKPYQHPTEYSFNNHSDMVSFHKSSVYFSFTSYPSEANVKEFFSFISWSLKTSFPMKRKVQRNKPFSDSSQLKTTRRKYSTDPIKNKLYSLQS